MFGCLTNSLFFHPIFHLFLQCSRFKDLKDATFMYQFLDRFHYVYFRIRTYWCGDVEPNYLTLPLPLQRELDNILNRNYMAHFTSLKNAVLHSEFISQDLV